MAIDGSFSTKSSIDRFLSRCPGASPLLRTTTADHTDDVEAIDAFSEIFLNRDYTIPLLGCFRPVFQKIIDNCIDSDGKSKSNPISRNGNRFDLHSDASLAFCRALDLLPSLSISVFRYFDSSPPPFYRISMLDSAFKSPDIDPSSLLESLRVTYRLLLLNPESFRGIWDWYSFLHSLPLLVTVNPNFGDKASDIRWCVVQILALVLNLGEKTTILQLGIDPAEDFTCLLRWWEFCQDVSMEKAGFYVQLPLEPSMAVSLNKNGCLLRHCGNRISTGGESRSNFKTRRKLQQLGSRSESDGDPFVLTSTMEKCYEMTELAVSQKWPVLLYGPPGSGKTALINTMALDAGARILSIHMDDQIDGKMLAGGYICGEVPGEFKWQLGSLAMAVFTGMWVILENIDRASPDVQSLLVPLLEGSPLFDVGNGEMVRVGDSFRLFSTVSCGNLEGLSRHGNCKGLLSVLWRKMVVPPPTCDDLCDMVKIWYPKLDPIAGVMVQTFENIRVLNIEKPRFSGFFPGRFTARDLIKWCKRVDSLGVVFVEAALLSLYNRGLICEEAVDVFAASCSLPGGRLSVAAEIYTLWVHPGLPFVERKPQVEESISELRVGRVTLARVEVDGLGEPRKRFIETAGSLCLLERVACSVKYNEPVLLVGETGTGKTTLVQNLAERLGQRLTVLNLSQQSDISDLLGGYKPTDARFVCVPLYNEFAELFKKTFSAKRNENFLGYVQRQVRGRKWKAVMMAMQKGLTEYQALAGGEEESHGSGHKRKKNLDSDVGKCWDCFRARLEKVKAQVLAPSGVVFSFVEGAFVRALRRGEWVLLDEVNLAPPETLQRVGSVLEGEKGSLCLAERGDADYVRRHPDFRLFACMNPATDAGKRDLPLFLRSRFTEYFVEDIDGDRDLAAFIDSFVDRSVVREGMVWKIVGFYRAAKKKSEEELQDGAGEKPQYSLRSLYRSLEYVRKTHKKLGFQRAIYDGFCMFFLTLLDCDGARVMHRMILSELLEDKEPKHVSFEVYLSGREEPNPSIGDGYVLTASVRGHLVNLGRAIMMKRYPVLLQGPTSSGKTSLVQYLAMVTGHEFVRINNHEHTDLQEYLGSYIADTQGRLVFHEGALARAVRGGHWVVLDELNLAPSDVLEALNRLLDDNRELFIPELGEMVRAHPDFMLFATQNPPSLYAGRKTLSRAFRNRFVEIHVDQIPDDELGTILEKRCRVPASYAAKMVDVMKELQSRRQQSRVFAGKDGFITPRDLFRWADRFNRFGCCYADLALDGYFLLAERLRDEGDKAVVRQVIEKHLRVQLKLGELYRRRPGGDRDEEGPAGSGSIVWTDSMWRVYYLVERCYRMQEPVLLVGETGGGKTTVCQLLSRVIGSRLHILNCHQCTETSDFLGGFYPLRERSALAAEFRILVTQLAEATRVQLSPDIDKASSALRELSVIIDEYKHSSVVDVTTDISGMCEGVKTKMEELYSKWQIIFSWQDGPLVRAMRGGDILLLDEISLADDSVLERLNSVLEMERKLSLAERGGPKLENIVAHPGFFLIATMNPGGDFGKKELSPALRNRFTEIWVPHVTDPVELHAIAIPRLSFPDPCRVLRPILSFWDWFNQTQPTRPLTVRDLLSWVEFVEVVGRDMPPEHACLHGAFLVLLDGLSLGTGMSKQEMLSLQEKSITFLVGQLNQFTGGGGDPSLGLEEFTRLESFGWGGELDPARDLPSSGVAGTFGIDPFYIERGGLRSETEGFEFSAPTTRRNTLRLLRAMQLRKPVLLEGSPGVGKTSLVTALGRSSGHRVVRINLSEHTELTDLLGSDLPVESDEGVRFSWSDGILLQALKDGAWVILDEVNLAPQSVLEGLNAILDHRAEVFVPEINRVFKCPTSFRVFACQNPARQGGGRKGLPRSFLNRFTKVYVEELAEADYLHICAALFPSVGTSLLSDLIAFNKRLYSEIVVFKKFAMDGYPWEFNLRDVIRSCQLIEGAPEKLQTSCFLNTVYLQRMRTPADRREVLRLYRQVFGTRPYLEPFPHVKLTPGHLLVGSCVTRRTGRVLDESMRSELKVLQECRHSMEAIAHCLRHGWLCILVGPPASGKTSLIRLMAQLTGNVLNEISLSPGTDISEMLGCFEQYDRLRKFPAIVARIDDYVNEFLGLRLERGAGDFVSSGLDKLAGKWLSFLSDFGTSHSLSSGSDHQKTTQQSVVLLAEIIERLLLQVEETASNVSWSRSDLEKTLGAVLKLREDGEKKHGSVKFEWVAGSLVKAIEKGEWVVLENAGLCNPTVLDRINSLVEPSGSITVNECGLVDGEPLVLRPHENFRMFLTVNPTHGEVSRAMRNRGVEIFLMPPYWLLGEGEDDDRLEEAEIRDVKRFLVLSGIPFPGMVDLMAKTHVFAKTEGSRHRFELTNLELHHWVKLFQKLLENGNQPLWSLHRSWEHAYLSSLGGSQDGSTIVDRVKALLPSDPQQLSASDLSQGCPLLQPGGWPTPLKLKDFILHSTASSVRQNCTYLELAVAHSSLLEYLSRIKKSPEIFLEFGHRVAYFTDFATLCAFIAPGSSTPAPSHDSGLTLVSHPKLMFFAVNWVVEQATEADLGLYLSWFKWMGAQLHPFSQFFASFSTLLEEELKHLLWRSIFDIRHKLFLQHKIDLDLHPIPLLSHSIFDFFGSQNHLSNAIDCVSRLRLGIHQWNEESRQKGGGSMRGFRPVFKFLRVLEEEILATVMESDSFTVLIRLYDEVLQDHLHLWTALCSEQYEHLLVSWRSLMKTTRKLEGFYPRAIDDLFTAVENLDRPFRGPGMEKSLLWVHGGHPFLPPTAHLFHKQQELLTLCQSIWPPPRGGFSEQDGGNIHMVEAIASSNSQLRHLAVQGICLSLTMMEEDGGGDSTVVLCRLEEMRQLLSQRFEDEKKKAETHLAVASSGASSPEPVACCYFNQEVLCMVEKLEAWKGALCIADHTSFLSDLNLLKKLSRIVLLEENKIFSQLTSLMEPLESSLEFALTRTSRSPLHFLPHQKILWVLQAWSVIHGAGEKISSFVLEMWFGWHSSMWDDAYFGTEEGDGSMVGLPTILRPVKAASVTRLMGDTSVKCYHGQCSKLRAISRSLWESTEVENNGEFTDFLLSSACSLLLQIIYAHKKLFDSETFCLVKAVLTVQESHNVVTKGEVRRVCSILASSKNHGFRSLVESHIEPLLEDLFCQPLETRLRPLYTLGCAWMGIGRLRFHLLVVGGGEIDPVMKHSVKYDQLLGKISSLELELETRRECNHLVGWSYSARVTFEQKEEDLRKLKIELKWLEKKVVRRAGVGKFTKLKHECREFLKMAEYFAESTKKVMGEDLARAADQICSWQETAASFVRHLSEEYGSYVDIIQPVQLAVFEMKLGLSLILSGVGQMEDRDCVLETVHSFLKFPRGCHYGNLDVAVIKNEESDHPFCRISLPESSWAGYVDLMARSDMVAKVDKTGEAVANVRLGAAVSQSVLTCVAHFVSHSRVMDKSTLVLLDVIFDRFVNLWMKVKLQAKKRSDFGAQQYRFRPRDFKIEGVFGVDVSTLGGLLDRETFMEWKEMLAGEGGENEGGKQEIAMEEEECILSEDCVSAAVVQAHTALFNPAWIAAGVSDDDIFHLFIDTYGSAMSIIRYIGPLCSFFDDKLVQEHLLRISLSHREMSLPVQRAYNFYKDANPPVMAGMVKVMEALRDCIGSLLSEWEEHVGVRKIMEVTAMLLSLSLSTPLAKVLSGLHFLLSRMWMFRESFPKSDLANQVKPVLSLVASWHKIEFDSWGTLVDDVEKQYSANAEKLWFPLYSVIMRRPSSEAADEADGHNESTVGSLEEFIHTSSIGEFGKRIELLFSFHGQIEAGIRLGHYSAVRDSENLKIMYNVFGFYAQFLPMVVEYIQCARESIEKEFKGVMKLSRWERFDSYLSVENVKRTQQKVKKLLQKYSDVLQQPVVVILNRELAANGLRSPNTREDSFVKNEAMMKAALDIVQSTESHSSDRLADWEREVAGRVHPPEEDTDAVLISPAPEWSCESCEGGWKDVWTPLEGLCKAAIYCYDIWKNGEKNLGKRRALHELLKVMEKCGLSGRRSSLSGQWWFFQQSYSGRHLLEMGHRSSDETSSKSLSGVRGSNCSLDMEWVKSNRYYFSSVASLMLLQQSGQGFHKDFTLVQVEKSISFLGHLIAVQQEQRAAAYAFSGKLQMLRECVLSFDNLCTSTCGASCPDTLDKWDVSPNQNPTLKCMWQQKLAFDSFCSLFSEQALLLNTFRDSHLATCTGMGDGPVKAVRFIEKAAPALENSKALLDSYLLCPTGVTLVGDEPLPPTLISKRMEETVHNNFQTVKDLEQHYSCFSSENPAAKNLFRESFGSGLGNLVEMMKGAADLFYSDIQKKKKIHPQDSGYLKLKAGFDSTIDGISKRALATLTKLSSPPSSTVAAAGSELPGKIVSWKAVFASYSDVLELDVICDELVRTIYAAREVVEYGGRDVGGICSEVGDKLKSVSGLMDLIVKFGDGVLRDMMATNITVSMITTAVGQMLALLYSEGFGSSCEEEDEGDDQNKCQDDGKGTGMGEGVGFNDVSDQIVDEDQLLGTSDMRDEDKEEGRQMPGKDEKGIEMEQDFEADAFSLSGGESEGGEESETESENEQLESAMGETGDDSNIVGEKPCNEDMEGDDNGWDDKTRQSGPSQRDGDQTDLELRARENGHESSLEEDEAPEFNPELLKEDGDGSNGDSDGDGGDDDRKIKDDFGKLDNSDNVSTGSPALEDGGTDPAGEDDQLEVAGEDVPMDEGETGPGSPEELAEKEADGSGEEDDDARVGEEVSGGDGIEDPAEKRESDAAMDLSGGLLEIPHAGYGGMPPPHSAALCPSIGEAVMRVPGSGNPAPEMKQPESDRCDGTASVGDPNPMKHQEEEPLLGESAAGAVTGDRHDTRTCEPDRSLLPKAQANPYRSVGDALQEWKERVRVSMDLDSNGEDDGGKVDTGEDAMEDGCDEFGYAAGADAQTLGPATSDQVDGRVNNQDTDEAGREGDGGPPPHHVVDRETENHEAEPCGRSCTRAGEMVQAEEEEEEEGEEVLKDGEEDEEMEGENPGGSSVIFREGYRDEEMTEWVSDQGGAGDPAEVEATAEGEALWRKYEGMTERSSGELTEQLRLAMEPTAASRLEGGYRTGKRINMKKVIPYIASHYRKDKIWLRRTRRSRRDYQVVVAIDDSRSMAENRCGGVAMESLVTVCRAMGRLEVGDLAVVSFGRKGKVRVLHGFGRGVFTGEAGTRVVSSLTFSQENTIEDGDPVADLLGYVDRMLDGGAAAGGDPVRQLVVIIGDGRVHQMGSVRRGVRDVLTRRERMVAFVVMDAAETPVAEIAEAAFVDGRIKMTKYIDSFPFPYYVLLRNVDELPRTLGDLLRQWFELIRERE